LRIENRELQESLDNDNSSNILEGLKKQIDEMKQALITKQKEIEQLKSENGNYRNMNAQIQSELEDSLLRCNEQDRENISVKKENADLKVRAKELENQVISSQNENEEMRDLFALVDNRLTGAEKKLNSFASTTGASDDFIEFWPAKSGYSESIRKGGNREFRTNSDDPNCSSGFKAGDSPNARWEGMVLRLKKRQHKLLAIIGNLQEQLNAANVENERFRNKDLDAVIKLQLQTYEIEIDKSKTQINSLLKQNRELSEQVSSLNDLLADCEKSDAKGDVQSVYVENQVLANKLAQITNEIRTRTDEYEMCRSENVALRQELIREKQIQAENERLRRQLETMNCEIETARVEKVVLEKSFELEKERLFGEEIEELKRGDLAGLKRALEMAGSKEELGPLTSRQRKALRVIGRMWFENLPFGELHD
jgi:hypothetical protein